MRWTRSRWPLQLCCLICLHTALTCHYALRRNKTHFCEFAIAKGLSSCIRSCISLTVQEHYNVSFQEHHPFILQDRQRQRQSSLSRTVKGDASLRPHWKHSPPQVHCYGCRPRRRRVTPSHTSHQNHCHPFPLQATPHVLAPCSLHLH